MKVILTGKNSYIATNTASVLRSRGHEAICISVRDGVSDLDFRGADTVIHCAAIVHKKESKFRDEYDKVNHVLTLQTAEKAKEQGVRHFVFLSTMAVYGMKEGEINSDTPLNPYTLYGESKLRAENGLRELESDDFCVTAVRPPMVYGRDCPGNYSRLALLSRLLPVIPLTEGRKSFIYIGNLSRFIADLTENRLRGTFMPMDGRYTSASELMQLMSGKKYSEFLGRLVSRIKHPLFRKIFAPLWYSQDTAYKVDYVSIEDAVASGIE